MKKSKAVTAGLLALLLCFALCACRTHESLDRKRSVEAVVMNEVPHRIRMMSVSFSIDSDPVGTTCVETAKEGRSLDTSAFIFPLYENEVPSEEALQRLSITLQVTEEGGGTFDVETLSLPSKFGDRHELQLTYADGRYQVRQIDGA